MLTIFKKFDQKDNYLLSAKEFFKALTEMNMLYDQVEVERMVMHISNGNMELNFKEFLD